MKFLFTCGGTAGHINPALGVAARIKELMPDAEILFVGAEGKMETNLVPREGFELKTVKITNIRRGFSAEAIRHNIGTAKNVISAVGQAKKIVKEFRPDIAVGTGGYVCYPVIKAAASKGIPTVIHESNAVPGLTTKMLAGSVDKILVGFEESAKNYNRPEKVVVTGTPVRTDFHVADKAAAKAELGLPSDKPLVVSVWGSLGAAHMNDIMVGFIKRALNKPTFTLIHSAGSGGYGKMLRELEQEGVRDWETAGFEIREYIYDMAKVMAAADIVMCRAGASTLSELSVMGKPAILIPSPNVTNNHQEKNARMLEKAGAAKVLLEGEFSEDALLGTVTEILSDKERLNLMAEKMSGLGAANANERIVEIVLELAAGK